MVSDVDLPKGRQAWHAPCVVSNRRTESSNSVAARLMSEIISNRRDDVLFYPPAFTEGKFVWKIFCRCAESRLAVGAALPMHRPDHGQERLLAFVALKQGDSEYTMFTEYKESTIIGEANSIPQYSHGILTRRICKHFNNCKSWWRWW